MKLQKIVGNLLDELRKFYMNGSAIQIFLDGSQVIESSRQYLHLQTHILQKTVVGCPLRDFKQKLMQIWLQKFLDPVSFSQVLTFYYTIGILNGNLGNFFPLFYKLGRYITFNYNALYLCLVSLKNPAGECTINVLLLEKTRQYLLLQIDILQKTVVACPCPALQFDKPLGFHRVIQMFFLDI